MARKILLSIVTTEKMKNKEARKCVRDTYYQRKKQERKM
jgi:hypothetical protein